MYNVNNVMFLIWVVHVINVLYVKIIICVGIVVLSISISILLLRLGIRWERIGIWRLMRSFRIPVCRRLWGRLRRLGLMGLMCLFNLKLYPKRKRDFSNNKRGIKRIHNQYHPTHQLLINQFLIQCLIQCLINHSLVHQYLTHRLTHLLILIIHITRHLIWTLLLTQPPMSNQALLQFPINNLHQIQSLIQLPLFINLLT